MKKTCIKCDIEQSEDDFYMSRGKKTNVCKACTKKRVQKRYSEKREVILEKSRNHRKDNPEQFWKWRENKHNRREELAKKLKEGRPCADCGGVFHFAAMDFDHTDPENKGYSGKGGRSLLSLNKKQIEEEVAKCDLVCANCHRVRTYNRNKRRIQNEKRGDIHPT